MTRTIDPNTAAVLNRKDTTSAPNYGDRAVLVETARQVVNECRYKGAPQLTPNSSSEDIAEWLQWCDPNGCHTARLAQVEGCPPYRTESAWEALRSMLGMD